LCWLKSSPVRAELVEAQALYLPFDKLRANG
jgi:hypothetical protein